MYIDTCNHVITCVYVDVYLYLRNSEKLSFHVMGWGSNFVG